MDCVLRAAEADIGRQTEFVLSIIKITACVGFMILGIIINVGGVPTDTRGYIGNRYL